MRSIFLAHAEADAPFASDLARFLEIGCDAICETDEGVLAPGEDLIAKAEQGLSADVLILLLSPASCPTRWRRDRWEPVLIDQAKELGSEVFSVLLAECPFPDLLRRSNFADASLPEKRLTAMRLVKRKIWQPGTTSLKISSDLESLYSAVADRPGIHTAESADVTRFVGEAELEFEAIVWLACANRNLTQATGALGAELGLSLPGTLDQNVAAIRAVLDERRCLLVLDAPSAEIVAELAVEGRTSTLIAPDAVRIGECPETFAYARELVMAHRNAEAYELLHRLLATGVSVENCARELVWICEVWDRIEEANALRIHYRPAGFEQLVLF